MVKDLIEDIKRPKRSLQDVLPSIPVVTPPSPSRVVKKPRPPRHFFWVVWLVILAAITLIFYFASTIFGQANVVVTPRRLSLVISGTYRALNLPTASTSSPTTLGFQTMTIRDKESVTVKAEGMVSVKERSSGTIMITNRYSKTSQKLVANTRFESSTGKIYRIREAVTIPGYTVANGAITPGELTVTVTADQPGPDYNGTLSTFTIPGFKGDPRFETIVAQAKIPFIGGFIGDRKVVNSQARSAAGDELVRQLKERLLIEAISQTPDGYVWYPNSVFWRLSEEVTDDVALGEEEVSITRQVELVAPIFSRAELSQVLARQFALTYDEVPVLIENLEQFNFRLIGQVPDPDRVPELNFTLSGEGVLVWQFESSSLKHDLLGRAAGDYQAVFVKYPSIVSSSATFSPLWLRHFTTDPKRIILTIEKPSVKMSSTTNQYDTSDGN